MDSKVTESLLVYMLLASFGNGDESPYGPVVSALQILAEEKAHMGIGYILTSTIIYQSKPGNFN